jgi:hypothetical protein
MLKLALLSAAAWGSLSLLTTLLWIALWGANRDDDALARVRRDNRPQDDR